VSPHRIRLRKPWKYEACEAEARWRRRFGRPTGLGPDTTVSLVVENAAAPLHIRLNGELLGRVSRQGEAGRFVVTNRLLLQNELAILTDEALPASHGIDPLSPPADVCLEILSNKGYDD